MSPNSAKTIFVRHAGKSVIGYVVDSVATGTAKEHSDINVTPVRDTPQPFSDRVRKIIRLRLGWGRPTC